VAVQALGQPVDLGVHAAHRRGGLRAAQGAGQLWVQRTVLGVLVGQQGVLQEGVGGAKGHQGGVEVTGRDLMRGVAEHRQVVAHPVVLVGELPHQLLGVAAQRRRPGVVPAQGAQGVEDDR